MNSSPIKHRHFRRYMDNVGDVQVRGYDPVTGKPLHKKMAKVSTSLAAGIRDHYKRSTTRNLPQAFSANYHES